MTTDIIKNLEEDIAYWSYKANCAWEDMQSSTNDNDIMSAHSSYFTYSGIVDELSHQLNNILNKTDNIRK